MDIEKLINSITLNNYRSVSEKDVWIIEYEGKIIKCRNNRVAFTSKQSASNALTNFVFDIIKYEDEKEFREKCKGNKSKFIKDNSKIRVITLEEYVQEAIDGVLDFVD